MIVNRNYESLLNLTIDQIYSDDIDDTLMSLLREQYEKKCHISGYVLKVNKIIKRSMVKIMKNDLEGNGSVNLVFSVKLLVLGRGSLIPSAQILKIDSRRKIIAKTDITNIKIESDSRFFGLAKDDKIPLMVKGSHYSHGSEKVSIIANIFTLPNIVVNYKVSGELTEKQIKILTKLMDKITTIKENMKDLSKTSLKHFVQMFYPFKAFVNMPVSYESANLFDKVNEYISNPKEEVWCRHPNINMLTPDIGITNTDDYVNGHVFDISLQMLLTYRNFLNLLVDLCNEYPDASTLATNKKVWNLYNRNVKV